MIFRGFGYQVFHFYRKDLMFVRKVKANGCLYKYDTNVKKSWLSANFFC